MFFNKRRLQASLIKFGNSLESCDNFKTTRIMEDSRSSTLKAGFASIVPQNDALKYISTLLYYCTRSNGSHAYVSTNIP